MIMRKAGGSRIALIDLSVICLLCGCATPAKTALPAQEPVKGAAQEALLTRPEGGTFEQQIRRRANQALNKVGATADQKTAVDELLIFNSAALQDCVGGSERRLVKTLSILASCQNQGQALDALEKADIPLSDKCFMLGSDIIAEFTETLNEQQRESLVAEWRLMSSRE